MKCFKVAFVVGSCGKDLDLGVIFSQIDENKLCARTPETHNSASQSHFLALKEVSVFNLFTFVFLSELSDSHVSVELVWIWVQTFASHLLQELDPVVSVL